MIGVFGGTFDPIHFGHLRTALEVAEYMGMAQVRFIPCGTPPHRESPQASAAQRLAMVRAATQGERQFVADDREIRRNGPSYMVETLESLREELGADQSLGLILGLDAFSALTGWRRWQDLIALAHLIVMTRPGWSAADIRQAELQALWQRHGGSDPGHCNNMASGGVVFCPVTELNISSTAIRQQLRLGKSVRYLLPDAVLDLIHQQHIYAQESKN